MLSSACRYLRKQDEARGAHPASVDMRGTLPVIAVAAALSAAGRPGLRSLLTPPPGVKVAVSVKVSKVCRNLQEMLQLQGAASCT